MEHCFIGFSLMFNKSKLKKKEKLNFKLIYLKNILNHLSFFVNSKNNLNFF